jgi:hypothetical protein
MFGIPIIGAILQMITGIFGKYEDTQLGKYTVDGKVDTEAMRASADIIASTRDDPGIRLLRDMALFPPVVWSMLVGWDTIVAKHYPWLMFHVVNYPKAVEYIPYMAFVFLFGAVGLTMWKRR